MAERIGYDGGTISKIEAGDNPYTQRTLEALARIYGTTPAALLSVNPSEVTASQIDQALAGISVRGKESVSRLLSHISDLTPANIESFVTMIDFSIQANVASREQSQTDARSESASNRRESESSQ